MSFHVPNQYRVHESELRPSDDFGNNGWFKYRISSSVVLIIIASDGFGWEHVSVSLSYRCPTWEEMCIVKNMFWDEQDCVIQYHPPEAEFINNHPYCLHMWAKKGYEFPRPPNITVGIK